MIRGSVSLFRRCSIVLMMCWGICGWVQAEKVDLEKAERIAQRYVESRQRLQTKAGVRLKYTATNRREHYGRIQRTTTPNDQDTVYYYVFDAGNGFVIVAGDDAVRPILGYSINGNYNENNLPPNFACWMNNLQQEIADTQMQKLPQTEVVRQEWDRYMSGIVKNDATSAVGPLLQTKWSQGAPYNNQCPSYGGTRCVTGCVATAMAQIMKYHQQPARGSGQSEAHTTTTLKIDIPSVDFEVNYDWENMLDVYTDTADTIQQNAVATLMYHCGVSVKMDYADESGASSALVPKALTTYFGYDKSMMLISRGGYDITGWETLIREQIDMGLPVFYAGSNPCTGHAFVCDGYDNTGLFHFNWGWGGSNDGYFVTTSLNPGQIFNNGHEIIINIKPDNKPNLFNVGSGTNDDPYIIATPAQLANLSELVNACNTDYSDKYYKLTADLDLSKYNTNWETGTGTGWIPVGNSNCPFKGEFDGNNKKITGLYIQTVEDYVGLFGYIDESAKIINLGIENANIKGGNNVGGIAGNVNNSSITGCYVTGSVEGGGISVGGIAGRVVSNSNLFNCYSTGMVSGNMQVGGIAGSVLQTSNIVNCYSIGIVSGGSYIGGIVGRIYEGCNQTNGAALNPIVEGVDDYVGRVAGENNGLLLGNIAFCNISTDNGVKFQGVNTGAGLGGESRSAAELQTATGFPSGFTSDPWTYEAGKLPGLFGKTVEMPEHLRSLIKVTGLFDLLLNNNGSITVYPVTYVDDPDLCDKTFRFVVDGNVYANWTFTCEDIGLQTLSIVAIDADNNRSEPQKVEFTVSDQSPPVFDVFFQGVVLNETGNVTVYPADFVRNVKDNCSDVKNIKFWFFVDGADRESLSFTCNDIGSHTLSIFAIDRRGNRSQPKEVTFTVRDLMPPDFDIIADKDIPIDINGTVTVYPIDFVENICVYEGDSNNINFMFEVNGVNYSSLTFTCDSIDDYIIPIVATLGKCSRSQPKLVSFTISDQLPPDVRCKSVALTLDNDGKSTLTVEMIDNGSVDNCEIVSIQIKRTLDSDDLYANKFDLGRSDLDASVNGRISITLRAIDASGNEASCTAAIPILPPDLHDIPNIFTPNGDGFNDTWEIPEIKYYPEASIRIYNRAKKLMVELIVAEMPWDGRDRNGILLESGYYLYQIELQKGGKIISGFVTVLR